jgi:hypothetical protein
VTCAEHAGAEVVVTRQGAEADLTDMRLVG